jgi:biopolymer transport protein ExbD/biopolymer transport protein TolR
MNVTPLVDVVLVLLIIFMVIAPALNEGEQLELPTITKPDPKPREMDPIDVLLALNGAVILEEERIQRGDLRPRLDALHRQDENRTLLLKIDTAVPYRDVRETFGMLQEIGFKGVSLKVVKRDQGGDA